MNLIHVLVFLLGVATAIIATAIKTSDTHTACMEAHGVFGCHLVWVQK